MSGPINKTNQRADVFERGKDSEESLPPRGVHRDEMMVVMDHGKYYKVKRPSCPECGSGNVTKDNLSASICQNCGTVCSDSEEMVMDKMSAHQTERHRDQ